MLLDHARAIGEPEGLIDLAAASMSQPSDSAPHNDHMHVRIYCPPGEPTCRDYALRPPAKKPPVAHAFDRRCDHRAARRASDHRHAVAARPALVARR
jgi:hypothetical protein